MKLEVSLLEEGKTLRVKSTIEENDSVTVGSQTFQEFEVSELGLDLDRLSLEEDNEEFFSLVDEEETPEESPESEAEEEGGAEEDNESA